MTLRQSLAHWMRLMADRLDPVPDPLDANLEFVASLKREAAEWSMADECEAIRKEQEAEANRPHLRSVK